MIFLHRYKKYIILAKYPIIPLNTTIIIDIDQCLFGISVWKDKMVVLFHSRYGKYKHYLNHQRVKQLDLLSIQKSKVYYTFCIQVENPREFMVIYLFDKNPEVKNIRYIIIDYYRQILRASEW